jgi:hypothetical protein
MREFDEIHGRNSFDLGPCGEKLGESARSGAEVKHGPPDPNLRGS